jgi:hypothetical protein
MTGPSRARKHTAEHERAFMARALSGIARQEQGGDSVMQHRAFEIGLFVFGL